jgi:hypothetical protein
MLLLFIFLSTALCGSVVSEYHYHCDDGEILLGNNSLPAQFNGKSIGEAYLPGNATTGTIHDISTGHHFCQQDWYLTARDGGSWEHIPGLKANLTRMSLSPVASPITRDLQKRIPFLGATLFAAGKIILTKTFQLVCCGSSQESPLENVFDDTGSVVEFADRFTYTLTGQSVDAVVGAFGQTGGTIAEAVAQPDVFGELANIAMYAFEIFLD